MNKKQLVERVAKEAKLSKANVETVISATLQTVMSETKKGRDVRLLGFGTFTSKKRKARDGRNPQTGEKVRIQAAKYPKFKAGTEFRRCVNS